jgi:hypothetical protein
MHTFVDVIRCCRELQLEPEMEVEVEIQFQMNRLLFCQMHYAIDLLKDTEIVFPDVSKINQSWNVKSCLQIRYSFAAFYPQLLLITIMI